MRTNLTRHEISNHVKSDLKQMAARLKELRELRAEVVTAFSLPAWCPSAVPRNTSASFRRQEAAILRASNIDDRINCIKAQIQSYIDVIRANRESVANPDEKIYILERRYLDGVEWAKIQSELFGDNDKNKIKRKMYRLHDSACADVFIYWETVGRGEKTCLKKV